MLRLIKKHLTACSKTSEKDWKCKGKGGGKVACPFYVIGPNPTNPTGPRIKVHTETSAEQTARAFLAEFERALFDPKPRTEAEPAPQHNLVDVIDAYLLTKKFRSVDRRKRLRRQLTKMADYLKQNFGRQFVTDVERDDLEKYMFSWEGEVTTLKTQRENMKSFWLYCERNDYTKKNISASLPPIGDHRVLKQRRQRIPTLTHEEIAQVFSAMDRCEEGFKREGSNVARQLKSFTMIQRYTGMAVGDVTKLRLDEVVGNKVVVSRKKTGEAVWTVIPNEAVEALRSCTADSDEYFFWSGKGEHHTRASKWGGRLQKFYVFAGLRVQSVEKRRRSGGKLKDQLEVVEVSSVTPHFWRHTFVRDHYLLGTPVETIAELIGDDAETVRKYYSSFDTLRQQKLITHQEKFFEFANSQLSQAAS